MNRSMARSGLVTGLAATAAIALAACSSSSTSSAGQSTTPAGSGANVAAAKAFIAPYLGKPTAFPVDTPLKTAPPKSLKMAQLQFGTPTGALVATLLQAAAKVAGVPMTTVKASATASDTQSAVDSIIADKPAATILPASEPSLFSSQLAALHQQGSKIVSVGVIDPTKYGIDASMFDQRMATLIGKVLADWVIAEHGGNQKVVFYETPELSFTGVEKASFGAELKANCSSCSVRYFDIPATTAGTTAPQAVVSDLQSNPSTTVAVFGTGDAVFGVPPALKVAGISMPIATFGPDPTSLQYVQNGSVSADFTFDAAVAEWTAMDEAFRIAEGMPLTAVERSGLPPVELLEKNTVPANISHGFTAYPDFASRFATLWKVAS